MWLNLIVCERKLANHVDFSHTEDEPSKSVRLATHGDYESVLDLDRNVYDGADYLPSRYHLYIDDPRRYCYVALIDGEIVCKPLVYKCTLF